MRPASEQFRLVLEQMRRPPGSRRVTTVKYQSVQRQGQRTLNSFDTKDVHQEVIIPAAELAFHGEAFFAPVLLQE